MVFQVAKPAVGDGVAKPAQDLHPAPAGQQGGQEDPRQGHYEAVCSEQRRPEAGGTGLRSVRTAVRQGGRNQPFKLHLRSVQGGGQELEYKIFLDTYLDTLCVVSRTPSRGVVDS
jgi:hypothetical protein